MSSLDDFKPGNEDWGAPRSPKEEEEVETFKESIEVEYDPMPANDDYIPDNYRASSNYGAPANTPPTSYNNNAGNTYNKYYSNGTFTTETPNFTPPVNNEYMGNGNNGYMGNYNNAGNTYDPINESLGYNPNIPAGYNSYGSSGWSPKSKLVAGLLGIFLGVFGVHNFYLGFTGKAIAQLLITILSFGILSFVSATWGLIEGILILASATGTKWDLDAENRPMAPLGSN